MRTDTSTVNVLPQEYVTRQYADSKIGSSFQRNDGSLAQLFDNGVFVVSPNGDQTITNTIVTTTYTGKLGIRMWYDDVSRIAGSSYDLNRGLSLHGDQSDLNSNRLLIRVADTVAYGPIRYDSLVGITDDSHLVNRAWANTALNQKANANASLSSFSVPVTGIDMNGQTLNNLPDPVTDQQAATKAWTMTQINTGGSQTSYNTQVVLGNTPIATGNTNTVYTLPFNPATIPINQGSIIQGVDWVR